jgi:hypothetical protein
LAPTAFSKVTARRVKMSERDALALAARWEAAAMDCWASVRVAAFAAAIVFAVSRRASPIREGMEAKAMMRLIATPAMAMPTAVKAEGRSTTPGLPTPKPAKMMAAPMATATTALRV